MHRAWLASLLLCAATLFGHARGQSVLYVDDDAPAGGSGLTWETAYNDLQAALSAAAASGGVINEIRVAEGVYRPAPANGSRSNLFILRNGLAIRGGYAGLSQPDHDIRVIDLYESILSGDLNGNDGPDFVNRLENSYHVVGGSGINSSAVLDGFTITGGFADGDNPNDRGAGIFLYPVANSPTFMNCRIRDNKVLKLPPATQDAKGGAMYAYQCTGTFSNCVFEGNEGDYGGAVYHLQSAPHWVNCTIRDNHAFKTGGGMYNFAADAIVDGTRFSGNSALAGGGIYNFNSDPLLTNCLLQHNSAIGSPASHGGGLLNEPGNPVLNNCVFSGNEAANRGGGLYNNLASHTVVQNSAFFANAAGSAGGLAIGGGTIDINSSIFVDNLEGGGSLDEAAQLRRYAGTLTINYSSVQGWTGTFGGTGNGFFEPAFVDGLGADGVPGTGDDNLRLSAASDCIDQGDPTLVINRAGADLDDHARVLCGRADIGPYEFGIGDFTCDRMIDLIDYASFPSCWSGPEAEPSVGGYEPFDFEFDSDVDLLDFAGFQNVFPDGNP